MNMTINNKFNIGDLIYLNTDEEQLLRQITGITINPDLSLIYNIIQGLEISRHYEIEMTKEKNTLITLNV